METMPAIFAPSTTFRLSADRRVTMIFFLAMSVARAVILTRSPTVNLDVSAFLRAAIESPVSILGTRAVKPGATAMARVSAETADTMPSISSPSESEASAAVPAMPAPDPSPPPASVAARAISLLSSTERLTVSSSMFPRSPAGPSVTTFKVAPTAIFFIGKSPSANSVAWSLPLRPFGSVKIACMDCTSFTTPSMARPAPTADASPDPAPLLDLAAGTVSRSLSPGDPLAALPATKAVTLRPTANLSVSTSSSLKRLFRRFTDAYAMVPP